MVVENLCGPLDIAASALERLGNRLALDVFLG
jgi:hypothetical protein